MLKPLDDVLLETLVQQSPDLQRRILWEQGPVRFIFQSGHNIRCGSDVKRFLTRQQFVRNATECPKIRAGIRWKTTRLFRAHVGRSARKTARTGFYVRKVNGL